MIDPTSRVEGAVGARTHDEITDHLVILGWSKVDAATFTKGEFELVFDTSTYVELYPLAGGSRVAEGPVNSIADLVDFLRDRSLLDG